MSQSRNTSLLEAHRILAEEEDTARRYWEDAMDWYVMQNNSTHQ